MDKCVDSSAGIIRHNTTLIVGSHLPMMTVSDGSIFVMALFGSLPPAGSFDLE
jgi:hypothetical protein